MKTQYGAQAVMKNNQNILKNLILICSAIIFVCVSFGCGSSNETDLIGNITDADYISKTVTDKGTLYLQTTSGSNVVVEAKAANTFAEGTEIILQERNLYSNETSPYGNVSSKVYILSGTEYINGSPKSISNIQKPVTITIPNTFSPNAKKYYLAYKSSSAQDWTYQMFGEDGREIVTSARMSFNGPFVIETYRLGYCFTVFAVMNGSDVVSKESVKNMIISIASDTYEVNNLGQTNETYKEDLKISTKIESLLTSALFSGATVESEITFYTKNPTASNITVNGKKVAEEIDTSANSLGNYKHVINVKDFEIDNSDSIRPVYSFILNLKNTLTSLFPEEFFVNTTLTSLEHSRFGSEKLCSRTLVSKPDVVSWNLLEPKNLEDVPVDSIISLNFSEAIDWKEEKEKFITFNSDKFSKILFTTFISEDKTKLTIVPQSSLAVDDVCRLSIAGGISAINSLSHTEDIVITFKTVSGSDKPEPQILSVVRKSPLYEENVATSTKIIFEFSKTIDWPEDIKEIVSFRSESFSEIDFGFTLSDEGKTLVITPSKPLEYSSKHLITINRVNAKDSSDYAEAVDFAFTTLSMPSYEASIALAKGSTVGDFAKLNSEIIIDFGNDVLSVSEVKESIKVYKGTSIIETELNFEEGSSRIAHLTFPNGLEASADYVVKMIATIQNIEKADIKKFGDFSFTTLPAITVAEIVPANNSTDLATDTVIYITFSGDVDWNSDCEQFVTLKDSNGLDINCIYTYTSSLKQLCVKPEKLVADSKYSVTLNKGLGRVIGQEFGNFVSDFSTCSADAVMATITANSDWFYNENVNPKMCFTDGSEVVIDFVKKPGNPTQAAEAVKVFVNGASADWNKTFSDTKLTMTPKVPLLEPENQIVVCMENAIKDESNADILPFAIANYILVPFHGRGSVESRFQIETPRQLDCMRDYLKDNFELKNNISFNGYVSSLYDDYADKGFKPVGDVKKPFTGSVEGNSFEISDLNINREYDSCIGLFGKCSGANIDGIKLSRTSESNKIIGGPNVGALIGLAANSTSITNCENNCEVVSRSYYIGGIVGKLDNNSFIKFCCNNADLENNVQYLGGICGYVSNESEISYSDNKGSLNSNANYCGGIAGRAESNSRLLNCKNMGVINGNSYLGGICGSVYNCDEVVDCVNNSSIYSGNSYVGGITGYGANTTFTDCKNLGNVIVSVTGGSATNNYYTSGICGCFSSSSIIRCSNGNESVAPIIESNRSCVGGICGYANSSSIEDSFNYGSVTGVQSVGGFIGYAYSNSSASKSANYGVASGSCYVGGISGFASSYITFEEVSNFGSINAGGQAGGIVGYATGHIKITDATNAANVTISGCSYTTMMAGGIAGAFYNNSTATNCCNATESVIIGKTSTYHIGGIMGGFTTGSKADNCWNFGKVEGPYNVGGVCGYMSGAQITNGYNYGEVIGDGRDRIGGIVGDSVNEEGILSYCYNHGTITLSSSETECSCIGGIAGRFQGNISNSVNKSDIVFDKYAHEVGGIVGKHLVSGSTIGSVTDCENFGSLSVSVNVSRQIGGVVGYADGIVASCINNGAVTVQKGTTSIQDIGGVVGYACRDMSDCHNFGNIYTDSADMIGGVVGECEGTITGCSNDGKVEFGQGMYIGGVVGHGYANILQCYNNNIASGSSVQGCGGIAGGVDDGDISECFNLGSISVPSGEDVGGIAGYACGNIEDSYNKGNIVGFNNVGGIAGSLFSNFLMSCYSIGSVSGFDTIGIIVGRLDSDAVFLNCFTLAPKPDLDFVGDADGAMVEDEYILVLDTGDESEVHFADFNIWDYEPFDGHIWNGDTVPITLLANPEP